MDILFLIGITIFLGTFAGKIFQKLKIPQVVGYIIVGLLLGESVFGILEQPTIEIFTPLINFALGLIGFRIGAELKGEVFKRYGRSIYTILFSEGLFTFFIVTVLVTLVTQKFYLGLLLGALASATAPAATTDVLWEYKTRGPLTSTLLSIVALDDGLSLIIYGFASVFAKAMITEANFNLVQGIGIPLLELAKSCLLGVAIGYGLFKILGHIRDKNRIFTFSITAVMITVGLAILLKLNFILATMVLGVVLANTSPDFSRRIFNDIERFSPPVFILFFVLVGAQLQLKLFANISIMLLAIVYLVGRSSGKMAGAWFGAFVSKANKNVRKYLGLCLFSQAGVAIGLAMVINHNFSLLGPEGKEIGALVLNIITATTFIVQLVGPVCVKFAITRADEAWRNVTAEDIIETHKIKDFMQKDFSIIRDNDSLSKIMEIIKEGDSYHFPVVGSQGKLTGLLSLGNLRSVFGEEQLGEIVLAKDIAVPFKKIVYPDQSLEEAFKVFDKREIDYLPVVGRNHFNKIIGIVEYYQVRKDVNKMLIERQQALE